MLEISCISSCLGRDPDNFTSSLGEFKNLGNTGLGVEGVGRDHGLDADGISPSHTDSSDDYLARISSLVSEEVRAVNEVGGFNHPGLLYRVSIKNS